MGRWYVVGLVMCTSTTDGSSNVKQDRVYRRSMRGQPLVATAECSNYIPEMREFKPAHAPSPAFHHPC